MTDPSDPLYATRSDAVATVWLNRPTKRNAVTLAMWAALPAVLSPLADDPAVRVVVVRGVGDNFCAGADVAEFGDQADAAGPDAAYAAINQAAEDALARCPKPTVAVVQGACVGGGCSIAVACDLRVADTTARFGITPARLGIVYPPEALERVTQLVGPARAKWLLYTGDLVDGDWALRSGLVDAVHPADQLEAAVAQLCASLAERSLLTQQATKEMVAAIVQSGGVGAGLAERWSKEAHASADSAEGLAAFHERRRPSFRWPSPSPSSPSPSSSS